MKTTKIFGIAILAIALIMSLSISAFATDITIEGGASGSEYAAFKLLNATDGGEGKFAYTLNSKYADILKTVTGKETDAEIVEYISELTGSDIQSFADSVYGAITSAALAADYTTSNNAFASVDQGYYLICETKIGDTADTFSLVMLDTAGKDNITVNTKEDLPTVSKQVEEINDSTGASSWGDSADYDIGDSINFEITGTVSGKYADYNSYYYSFIDTMDAGLTFNNDAKIYVVNGETETEVTASFTVTATENGFTATANLKEIAGVTIKADSLIVARYSVTLNENALSGKPGNKNEVYLEYENNPYHKADGDVITPDKPTTPSKTPEDVNIIFTFNTIVDKVDGFNNALDGAGFTLYKWNNTSSAWVEVCNEITGVTTFNFKGLDVGSYKLVESTVPQGYNKNEDIEFEIAAVYNTAVDPHVLIDIIVKNNDGEIISEGNEAIFATDIDNGDVKTTVVNKTGAELPSTGGIGVYVFYVVGAILAVGAIVVLVVRQRMAKTED